MLNDATLKQKAMEMGMIKTTKDAITPQQKALASYQVILEQTSDAQGDFARTSDGLANQQRILTAQIEDLKAEIGEGFLPVAQAATKGLTDYLSVGVRVEKAQKNLDTAYQRGQITMLKGMEIVDDMRWTEEGLAEAKNWLCDLTKNI